MATAPSVKQARARERGALRVSARQALGLGLVGLLVIAVVSYGWYVRHGGLFDDDWAITSSMISNRADGGGFWSGLSEIWTNLSWRPVLVLYNALIVAPLGWHTGWQFAWSVAMTFAFAGLLFAVLRQVRVPSPHAFAIAALVLVSTFGDAGVLWISGATIRFAGALYLGGLLMALKALRTTDGSTALRWHVGAGALYLLSMLSYEVTAGTVWAGILVYLAVAPRRAALRRWAVDLALSAAALVWSAALTPRPSHSLSTSFHHAREIARVYWNLYDGVVAPHWLPDHLPALATLLALAVGAAFVARRGDATVRRWTLVLAAGIVFVAATYVIFVPGDAYYLPNGAGTSNRMNTLPVAPTILVGYAAVMVLVTALLTLLRRRWVPAVALALGLAYGLGMFITNERALHADTHAWAGDYAISRGVLSAMRTALPHPRAGTFVVVLKAPGFIPNGNPVFYASWDLDAAAKKLYADGSIRAYNAYQGVSCTGDGLVVNGGSTAPYSSRDTSGDSTDTLTADYGTTVVVDAAKRRAYALPDALACQRTAQAVHAG